ncbi:MAG: MoaD/ThiS family protein [Candidatus Competibacteraceae bacterium]|nr:MoaD/ThiS family protein [Candidatus Competibacteraceae bacterium]MCB1810946.1 MoaD/ThiS family protein [Candidatus Competibacteraceae bacterium]
MSIRVKYFASLRDRLGRAEDELESGRATTIAEVWQALWPDTPMPANTLAAVNLEYQDPDYPVNDGDEVAFFPPVTGG